ncbi:carboxymuconolactone decarboxylase family protein [Martelella sp. HB161492]|uniref:carboxymuconolactone decarboxylase family protein n=1 Tax=Martelella sp. HB161492 TaxID=2720726 RepID=UPI001591CD58|nr:carboxymuconolactone decarboxylase family protein [Martelella sp. HB161492]
MTRPDYQKLAPDLVKAYYGFSARLTGTSVEATIRHLIDLRISQMNGCAFCVDMHSKEAKIDGEGELRLYHLPVWRESPLFSARERAALAFAEVLTEITDHDEINAAYQALRAEFCDAEIAELTFMVVSINGWNRIGIAYQSVPGSLDALYGLDKAGLELDAA